MDPKALASYIADLEGGIRRVTTARSRGSKTRGGTLGLGPASAKAGSDSASEETLTVKDHDVSTRLRRLIKAGQADPEALGWKYVLDPANDFGDIGIGVMIEWECDVYIPEAAAALSRSDGFHQASSTFGRLRPQPKSWG